MHILAPQELLGIPEDQFNLETAPVQRNDLMSGHRHSGAEQHRVTRHLTLFTDLLDDDCTHFSRPLHAPDHLSPHPLGRRFRNEVKALQVAEIHLAVELFWPSASSGMLAGIEILEVGVARKSGDEWETVTGHGLHHGFFRIVPIRNHSGQIKPWNSLEIKQHVIQLVSGLFQTTRGLRPGPGLTDIDRKCLSVLDVNQGTAGLLDPTFGPCGTAIPERAEVCGVLTRFAVKRGVDGQNAQWADQPTLNRRAHSRPVYCAPGNGPGVTSVQPTTDRTL